LGSKSLRLTQATTRSLLISAQYCPEFLVCQEERARTSRFRTPTRHMYVCISIRPAEKTKGISWTATRVLILSQRYSMPGHQRLSQTSESSQYRIHQASPTRQSPDLFNSAVLLIHPTQTEKRSLPYMKLIVPETSLVLRFSTVSYRICCSYSRYSPFLPDNGFLSWISGTRA